MLQMFFSSIFQHFDWILIRALWQPEKKEGGMSFLCFQFQWTNCVNQCIVIVVLKVPLFSTKIHVNNRPYVCIQYLDVPL